ncbi:MAG: Ig-like domain repeat protein [Solirubrobacteraceae bacterium]
MAAETRVHGVVLDSLGMPVVGGAVELRSGRQEGETSTGADGSYSLSVPSGTYSLTISTGEHGYEGYEGVGVGASVADLVVSGEVTEDFTMPPLGSLAVEVLNAEGTPVEAGLGGYQVRAAPDEPGETLEGTPVTYSDSGYAARSGPNFQHVFYALPGMAWKWNAEISGGLSSPEVEGETTLEGNKIILTLPEVVLLTQSVAFDSSPPNSPNVGSVYKVSATATSGLPVSLSIDPASTKKTCAIDAGTVAFTHVGKCIIDATQAGDERYQRAPGVNQAIVIVQSIAATSTTLLLSDASTKYGAENTETFAVTTSAGGGGTIPQGKVKIIANTKTLCTIKLVDGIGSCSPKAKALKIGSYSISAIFQDSSHFLESTSESVSLAVV